MKKYDKPTFQIISVSDVIVTSGLSGNGSSNDEIDPNNPLGVSF